MDTQDLSIAEMGRLLRSGSVTVRDAGARCAGTRRRARRRAARLRAGHRGSRAGRCAPRRRGTEGGPRPRAVPRHPLRAEGHLRHRRHPHDLPFQAAAERRAEGGQRRRRAAARGRRRAAGQARDARVRHRRSELRSAVPAGAQSVESASMSPAVRHPAPAPRSARAWCAWRWAPTPAARSAARRRGAARSASSRPTAASRVAACFRCPGRWTTSAR